MPAELDVLDSLFDDASAAVETLEKKPPPQKEKLSSSATDGVQRGRYLYFDLETIPDESRLDLFDLPPVPQMPSRRVLAECMPVADLLDGDIPTVKQYLTQANPCEEYLTAVDVAERQEKKPRKGVLDAISDYRTSLLTFASAADERRKLLSVTPEYCRIAALGWAIDDGPVHSLVIGEVISEAYIIEHFWRLATAGQVLVGFNCLGFDLPVLFIRSMLLDVEPSRRIDTSPFKSDVCDLMARRWPKGGAKGLKPTAKALGITIPTEDVDGSKVYELLQTDPVKVANYVASDIVITRELHRKYEGFFC